MEFQLVNKYLREPGKTFVAIRCQNPYTAYDRVLDGDLMAESDESLIKESCHRRARPSRSDCEYAAESCKCVSKNRRE